MAKRNQTETLEKGNVYFLFRPRVDNDDPRGMQDVQRLYMVLRPVQKDRYRLTVVGAKQMPDPGRKGGRRNWGFVDMVRKRPDSIARALEGGSYRTKTRGEQEQPAARPLGEGVYRILRHGDHTHLVYALELPQKRGEPQEEARIEPEASYIISIKNPQKGSPVNAGLSEERQASYPKRLQQVFEDRRFVDADPTDFLDHEGAEFVLISASEDVSQELGIRLHPQNESEASADMFKDLHLDRAANPAEPLFKGEWA